MPGYSFQGTNKCLDSKKIYPAPKAKKMTTPFARMIKQKKLLDNVLDLGVGGICYSNCLLDLEDQPEHRLRRYSEPLIIPPVKDKLVKHLLRIDRTIDQEETNYKGDDYTDPYTDSLLQPRLKSYKRLGSIGMTSSYLHLLNTYSDSTSYQRSLSWTCYERRSASTYLSLTSYQHSPSRACQNTISRPPSNNKLSQNLESTTYE